MTWILALPSLWRHDRHRGPVAALMCVAFPVWATVVGGDYLPFGRMIVPAAPFGALAVGAWLSERLQRGAQPSAWSLVVLAVVLMVVVVLTGEYWCGRCCRRGERSSGL